MKTILPKYERGDGVVLFLDGKHTDAFCHFLMGADTYGDDRSAFFVAYLYEFGLGVAQSYEKAAEYYLSVAHSDEGEAAYNLSVFYFFGLGVSRDLMRARAWMETSAALGCIEAQIYLAGMHMTGYLNDPAVAAVTLLPYHRAIHDFPTPLLSGDDIDAYTEDARIIPEGVSESEAFHMLSLAVSHEESYTEYVEPFVGYAKFMLAQFYIEAVTTEIDRQAGERLLLEAVREHKSPYAMAYIAEHRDEMRSDAFKAFLPTEL
jgi:TPR repeat protein